jgi:hypothetical protein
VYTPRGVLAYTFTQDTNRNNCSKYYVALYLAISVQIQV